MIGPGLRSATFSATADTMLKKSSANQNYGTDPTLRLRQSGKNRSLVRFDAAEIAQTIGQGTLRSASLELQVANSGGWGKTGRTVDAHRLTADWTEAGATWNCGIDTIPTNSQANCTTQWAGGTFQVTPTSTVVQTNGQTGTVAFDVSADLPAVVAGSPSFGWLIKKSDETKSGKADYAAREAGAPNAARLVVLFEVPGSGDTTPPFLHFEAPSTDLLFNQPRPTIRLSFLDTDSGIDPSKPQDHGRWRRGYCRLHHDRERGRLSSCCRPLGGGSRPASRGEGPGRAFPASPTRKGLRRCASRSAREPGRAIKR